MKEKIFIFLLTVLMSSTSLPANAQFKAGITGGMNICSFHVSDNSYREYVDKVRPGFVIGPTLMYRIPKTGFGFDVSALFDRRSAKSKDNSESKSISISSIQLPVNLRFGLDFGDMVYGFVFGGVQYGFNIGDKEKYIISGTGKATGHDLERWWVSQNSTLSMNLGIGGVVMEKVQVRVSYNLPLRKTGEIQQKDLSDNTVRTLTDGKAHACQVTLSYLF